MINFSKSLLLRRTMLFCPSQRRASEPPKPPPDLDPIMDLSSLEGAPMVNPKFIVPPDPPLPHIQANSRASIQYLLAKPLPERPSSTDAISPTQNCNGLHDWQHNRSTIGGNLRRASARRRTRHPLDEISPNDDQDEREVRSRLQTPHHPVRSRSCVPLTWLEDEKKWIVGEIYVSPTHDSRSQDDLASRSPVSPISPISPYTPWQDIFQRLDEHIEFNNRLCRENLLSQPPPYERHNFDQTHDTDYRDDRVARWVANTRRMHDDRRNWL